MAKFQNWGNGFAQAPYANNTPRYDKNQGFKVVRAKRSGAKHGFGKDSSEYVSGWNVSKQRGFIALIASPLTEKGVKENRNRFGGEYEFEVKSRKSGKTYERWLATVEFRQTGEKQKFSGYFHKESGKLYIPRLGMVASTRAKNGGYFGKVRVTNQN